ADSSKTETFVMTICDEGMDVPEEELVVIFDSFAQSSNTNNHSGGTGLGLSICKEIVKGGHLGDIRALPRHDDKKGVCFKVTLQNMRNVTDFYSSREHVLNR
ncbi:MAG: ATP-binding protein, partial [Gammaproteobacteria bacterium]|nr:ATP-binding protein [Gammaproteobacteria bacterium]